MASDAQHDLLMTRFTQIVFDLTISIVLGISGASPSLAVDPITPKDQTLYLERIAAEDFDFGDVGSGTTPCRESGQQTGVTSPGPSNGVLPECKTVTIFPERGISSMIHE